MAFKFMLDGISGLTRRDLIDEIKKARANKKLFESIIGFCESEAGGYDNIQWVSDSIEDFKSGDN